jgi:hypothetical protein
VEDGDNDNEEGESEEGESEHGDGDGDGNGGRGPGQRWQLQKTETDAQLLLHGKCSEEDRDEGGHWATLTAMCQVGGHADCNKSIPMSNGSPQGVLVEVSSSPHPAKIGALKVSVPDAGKNPLVL